MYFLYTNILVDICPNTTQNSHHLKAPDQNRQKLKTPKDKKLPLHTPSSCRIIYIKGAAKKIQQRIKEHKSDVKHKRLTALAIRKLVSGHQFSLDRTELLSKTASHYPRKYHEAIEVKKHPSNIGRDQGFYGIL